MRRINRFMMGLDVVVRTVIASHGAIPSTAATRLALGFITGLTLTAASMALNDHVDMDIGAVNAPRRPVPSGVVSPREALASSFILSL